MLAVNIQQGLTQAWEDIAVFVPKFLGFLAILVIGYFVAKLLARVVDDLLGRAGFDRWVERGSLRGALARSRMDASDILATLTFWTVLLLTLQLALGIFGENPVSDLIAGLLAYLPKVFVAVLILVIAAAVARVVTDVLRPTLGLVSGGDWMACGAGVALFVLGVFAALNQLEIAPEVVNGLLYALLAAVVGSIIVAVGGGGIETMRRYWQRAADDLESKGKEIRHSARVTAREETGRFPDQAGEFADEPTQPQRRIS